MSKTFYAVEAITRDYQTMWEGTYSECISYLQEYGYTHTEARIIKYKDSKKPQKLAIIENWE